MATPKFSSFVKQHGQLWCKTQKFNIYLVSNLANNDTNNTLYVEHDSDVISLEKVKADVIKDHIEMYNNIGINTVEGVTLDDIIEGLNKLNFVTLK